MAERQPNTPTHRAYSVIRREGQDDYWLNIGLVFSAQRQQWVQPDPPGVRRSTARSSVEKIC